MLIGRHVQIREFRPPRVEITTRFLVNKCHKKRVSKETCQTIVNCFCTRLKMLLRQSCLLYRHRLYLVYIRRNITPKLATPNKMAAKMKRTKTKKAKFFGFTCQLGMISSSYVLTKVDLRLPSSARAPPRWAASAYRRLGCFGVYCTLHILPCMSWYS